MNKRWIMKEPVLTEEEIKKLAKKAAISYSMARVLAGKGLTADKVNKYLDGTISDLYDPFLLKDMKIAVERINNAIKNKETVTIYGDYDVDGIAATAIVIKYLTSKGVVCNYYIPDREEEGYGINIEAIDKTSKEGTSLIITVDTGITAVAEVEHAKALGLDIIITDHHMPKEKIPNALAVINAKREDCEYPFKELSGTGVAFKLLCALEGNAKEVIKNYCDLVAIATVADVVPLTGENRILVSYGLRKIRKMPNLGILSVLESAGIEMRNVNSYIIGTGIAPRLNAAGRLGDAGRAVELILTNDATKAAQIAQELNDENERRKRLGEEILKETIQEIETGKYDNDKILVLAHDTWHRGVIGIIASWITNKYHKSTILISVSNEDGKGSGRSIPGFNLLDAVSACTNVLDKFGGHSMAAGLTIKKDKIDEFRQMINEYVDKNIDISELVPGIYIDFELPCNADLLRFATELKTMEPFGMGNEKPVFSITGAEVLKIRNSKDEKHLFMQIKKGGQMINCVGFGQGSLKDIYHEGETVNIAAELARNDFGGISAPQLHIIDINK